MSLTPTAGALFFAEVAHLTPSVLAAKLRDDGELAEADPRSCTRPPGPVGIAIHPLREGWVAVVDSADGAQGIGAGDWSRAALVANHLGAVAIWHRVYSNELALAVRFDRGGDAFHVIAGTAEHVAAWLTERGVPLAASTRPKDAPSDALLLAIRYDPARYATGPDETTAATLVALAAALDAGDVATVRQRIADAGAAALQLALGVVRAARGEKAETALKELARAAVKEPLRPRPVLKELTLEEEVLRRAAELSADDGIAFVSFVDRLDAIEREAESRSAWADAAGVARLATTLEAAGRWRDAYTCCERLVLRTDTPPWTHVSHALHALLKSAPGRIALDGEIAKLVTACEKRLPQLGQEAQDAILYNLGCVYARAGDTKRALASLQRCKAIFAQNATPQTDPDLAALRGSQELEAILERASDPASAHGPMPVDELELSVRAAGVLAEREVATVADLLRLDPATLPKRVAAEIRMMLAEQLAITWGTAEEEVAYEPPPERAVPRAAIQLVPSDEADRFTSRIGGLPNAPDASSAWPSTAHRPMAFVLQLVGTSAGGDVDMGDVSVLQVFADLDGEYYDDHRVVLHRGPCSAVMKAPAGLDPKPARVMTFVPGADDRILLDATGEDDADALAAAGVDADTYDDAHSHAWCDKIRGVPIGANLDPDVKDSRGEPMECLLQLTTYDDWFLWYVFLNRDRSEAVAQIVRG